ncbi:MAG: AEC family transporter [Hyphomicrobiaceae bacterium]
MSAIVSTVAPVFALILIGYLTTRWGAISQEAAKGLGEFAFVIAMPSLLFRTMVVSPPTTGSPTDILLAFFLSAAVAWVTTTVLAKAWLKRTGLEATALAMGASFGNSVMLGFPLGLAHYGEAAAPAMAIIIAAHSPILWMVASLQAEWMSGKGTVDLGGRVRDVIKDLAVNPVVFGVVLGSLWRFTGLGLNSVPDSILNLLGSAGVPASLFALGASLSRYKLRGDLDVLWLVVAVKLLLFPLVAYVLSIHVFALPESAANATILIAACPTGANAFLFAQRYDSAVGPVSQAVALGTAIAAVTISLLFAVRG